LPVDAGVKVDGIQLATGGRDRLRKSVSFKISTGVECGGVGWRSRTFGELGNFLIAPNDPVSHGPDGVESADFEVRVGQLVRDNRHAVYEGIGVGIAESDVHESQCGGGAVRHERIVIMLKQN